MECQGCIDNVCGHLLHQVGELVGCVLQVLGQDRLVDAEEGIWTGEHYCKCCKVSLQSRIDGETASRGIHAGHVLHIVDVLLGEFGSAVPMAVVHVLTDESVGPNSTIGINLRHVHVIQEVDQLLLSRWTVVPSCLLLETLFKNLLGHLSTGVEVEGNIGDEVLLVHVTEFLVQHERLPGAGHSDQHRCHLVLNEHVNEKLDPDRLPIVDEAHTQWHLWVQLKLWDLLLPRCELVVGRIHKHIKDCAPHWELEVFELLEEPL